MKNLETEEVEHSKPHERETQILVGELDTREQNLVRDHSIDKCLPPSNRDRTWLIKCFFILLNMKEIGEKLREARKQNGVSIEEASDDLKINLLELENLENGNYKAFKDIYDLKNSIRSYAKYLGLDENDILNEFNDYLFEKTSKISKDDIREVKNKEENEEKISSPYTKIGKTKHDIAPVVLLIVLLLFVSLIVYLILSFLKKDDDNRVALLERKEVVYYESTK